MATTSTPMTVAAFLEQYPNAEEIFKMALANQNVTPALVDYDSDPDSSSDEVDGEEICFVPTPHQVTGDVPIKRKRGRPKKVRTPEELAEIAEKEAAKELRRQEREARKAEKDAQPKRPRGRPKKVRTPEELAEIAEKEAAKELRRQEREARKAEKDAQPKRPRGRPKKVRTPEELAEIAEKEAAKELRRQEREARKAEKDAQPKRPRGRPKKVRTPEELAEIAEKEAAKEARDEERAMKKLMKSRDDAAKALEKHNEKTIIYARMLKAAEEYAEKWNIETSC